MGISMIPKEQFDLNKVYNGRIIKLLTYMSFDLGLFRLCWWKENPRSVAPEGFLGVNDSVQVVSKGLDESAANEGQSVVPKNTLFQLKLPIRFNKYFHRRWKVDYLDTANYSELIAARIGEELYPSKATPLLVPRVSFVYDVYDVYDGNGSNVFVASQYLTSHSEKDSKDESGVRNLVQYTDELPGTTRNGLFKYYNYVKNPSSKPQDFPVDELAPQTKSGVARALVLAAVLGDHDVNPANIMIVKRGGQDIVGKIDFGHGLNGLLNAPRLFGGKILKKDNFILDFLNREKVANFPNPAQSKLWRNYAGFMPSKEMQQALESISAINLTTGVTNAWAEFNALLVKLNENNDNQGILHFRKTLAGIHKNVTGRKLTLAKNTSDKELLDTVFKEIHGFVKKNIEQAHQAAKLMALQMSVDEYINNPDPKNYAQLTFNLKLVYLSQVPKEHRKTTFRVEKTPLTWIKNDEKVPAFFGDLDEYIAHRRKILSPQFKFSIFNKGAKIYPKDAAITKLPDNPELVINSDTMSISSSSQGASSDNDEPVVRDPKHLLPGSGKLF